MICLYVDGFGAEKDQWTKVGNVPYLSWGPASYVWEETAQQETGDYTFEDTAQAGHPTVVEIQVYCRRNPGVQTATVWIHDGAGWNNVGIVTPGAVNAWQTLDVSAILNTFAKINAAKIYLRYN